MPTITNIAAYHFAPLQDLSLLRVRLLDLCNAENLRGTILLSPEGINLFIAGTATGVDCLITELRHIDGLSDLYAKYSDSDEQPFRRMLVRLKKQIITFGPEGIDPRNYTSKKIAPRQLKQWLDEGRPLTLLDTRNDYEVKLGTFTNALPAGIDHFRQFPEAIRKLPQELRQQPIVMFCTGGIRCEKAGPLMEREGFQDIYQLDGGILKYFEECGGAHYRGECFVFDKRVGVDPALRETDSALCFNCQMPLSSEEQTHPHYRPPASCPHCYQTAMEAQAQELESMQAALDRAVSPLPGSIPAENRRPLQITQKHDGLRLLDFLCTVFSAVAPGKWEERILAGRILDPKEQPAQPDRIVRGGERFIHIEPAQIEPDVNPAIKLLYLDESILVLNKPAPLPMHPGGRFNRNTLSQFLNIAFAPSRPRHAHRLDANTSGVVVCARTRHFAGILQQQFANNEVEKDYLALIHGKPSDAEFVCDAPISAEPLPIGARDTGGENSLPARTLFKTLSYDDASDSTLLLARPVTGRTNQIRVHLWDIGHAIVGDPLYLSRRTLGLTQTLSPDSAPMCLHAWRIKFRHPVSGEVISFEAPPPDWAQPGIPKLA